MSDVEFKAWPKIPRGGGAESITISEKIDGTNACVIIQDDKIVGVQSRKRLITPEDDNYGFAGWVERNTESLLTLGDGYHYGEWAGLGIQKNPMLLEEKKFFLFNTYRWKGGCPDCCSIVPVLYEGEVGDDAIAEAMLDLSQRSMGVYSPEGVVVWYHKSRRYEKYTYRNNRGKWDV